MKQYLRKAVNKFLCWLFGVCIKDGIVYADDFVHGQPTCDCKDKE